MDDNRIKLGSFALQAAALSITPWPGNALLTLILKGEYHPLVMPPAPSHLLQALLARYQLHFSMQQGFFSKDLWSGIRNTSPFRIEVTIHSHGQRTYLVKDFIISTGHDKEEVRDHRDVGGHR